MGAPRVPTALQPLAQRLSRRLEGGLVLQFLTVLRQVKIYLNDDAMAEQIRAGFLAHLNDARPRVVIAHSLGSVVAVDALRLSSDSSVPMLITVGSPLGMRAVQSRLRRPAGAADAAVALPDVSRWLNVVRPRLTRSPPRVGCRGFGRWSRTTPSAMGRTRTASSATWESKWLDRRSWTGWPIERCAGTC